MDDLDVLLQDLEATIPEAKPSAKEGNYDDVLETFNANSHLNVLDSLIEGLYTSDEVAGSDRPISNSSSNQSSTRFPASASDEQTNGVEPQPNVQQQQSSITSASQQLDDLMASLHEFHFSVNNRNSSTSDHSSEPPYAKPQKQHKTSSSSQNAIVASPPNPDQITTDPAQLATSDKGDLDEMLNDMNKDLVKQGIRAASKGVCGACGKPVMGEVTTALGQVWHPEHFVCVVCDTEIGTSTFFEREGKPYCEEDYHRLFAPTCAYCEQAVLGQCVTALNKTWHPEHFFCAMCGNFFGDDGFHEFEGKPYCRADYYNMFAPKCGGCNKPILTNYISALNKKWHPECFVCRECMAPFTHGSFFELDGLPFCETHYHAKRGSLCAGCQKPITSRCISAMGKKFHQEHFVCAFCLKQLNKGTFKDHNDKPYCHQCFIKLFGKNMH